jgi:hypothetical protein
MSQQLGIDWNADVSQPVSGSTPLARHCSATGAQAASVTAGSKMAQLLTLFSQHRRLTLNETAALIGIQDHSLCSTWNRAKVTLNWIEETGEVRKRQVGYRIAPKNERKRGIRKGDKVPVFVEQAYHRITEAGRQAAFDLLKFKVSSMGGAS